MRSRLFRVGSSAVCLAIVLLFDRQAAVSASSLSTNEFDRGKSDPGNRVITCDHLVPHVSTVAANAGALVNLFVRERARRDAFTAIECGEERDGRRREAVLMIHGRSVPTLPAFDLTIDDGDRSHYDWALALARAGIDVFMADFQGSGLSPRPAMEDPCNAPAKQQLALLVPNPLDPRFVVAPCTPSYRRPLITSQSDLDELDTTVDFIRQLTGVDKVHLVSASQGAFRAGPYAADHSEKVASLFLYAAIYNPVFVSTPQPATTPMTLLTKGDVLAAWDAEPRCEGQLEQGIQDLVWNAIMDNDALGHSWGPAPAGAEPDAMPEGVMRVRTAVLSGWNQAKASGITVPTLIIAGELDRGDGGIQALAELYQTVQSTKKLRFKVQCAGHRMLWESQRKVLHAISKEWIKDGAVAGFETGEFYVDVEGRLTPM